MSPRAPSSLSPRATTVLFLGLVAALLAGCLRESSGTCGGGAVCPPGLQCADTGDERICILVTCGNGRLDLGEVCDDSNTRSGDGCPADCTAPCGDGVLDPEEVCDDGNTNDGDGCAADCRALDGIFLVSPSAVSFAVTEGDPLPAGVPVRIRLAYQGDTVLVGFAPGMPQPSWLSIVERPSTPSTAELELSVTDTSVRGQRSTTVRLLISHQNSSELEVFELPVTYRVEPFDLTMAASPTALAFTSTAGDLTVPPRAVEVAFNGDSVTPITAPPWLAVSPPSSSQSPTSFEVTISDLSLPAGTELSDDLVFRTTRGTQERTTRVAVSYRVTEMPELTLEVAPAAMTFAAFTGGALPPPQAVTATFSGASVDVIAVPDWVTLDGPPVPRQSPASFTVAINTTAFPGGTVQGGSLVFRTMRGAQQRLVAVPLEYHVAPVPEIHFVSPYVGIAGHGGTALVRGLGFPVSSQVRLRVGAPELAPVVPDSATQVTLHYPALPAGRYPVTFSSPSGAPSSAELVIVAPPALSYHAIDAPSRRSRLLYDAERQALYAVNRLDQEIERFAYSGGAWSRLPSRLMPLLTDVALAPDGRALFAITSDAVHEISLTDNLFAPVRRAGHPDPFCGGSLDQAVPTNHGKLFVISKLLGCTGYSSAYLYDLRARSLTRSVSLDRGLAAASADGSRIYGGGFSLDNIMVFNSLTNVISGIDLGVSVHAISVSRDASRVVLQNRLVYSRALTLLGNLPNRGPALVSHDGSRAFFYAEDGPGPRLEVYDLNGPPQQPGALYPLLKTVTLADSANGVSGSHPPVVMTNSPDDSVVFIAGDAKLLVVPVD